MRKILYFIIFSTQFSFAQPLFRNTNLSLETRLNDLLKQLTTEEKISLLGYRSKPIERLGIPAYNYWNEALHGVARAGKATIFPQAIGMAASFNPALMQQVGDVISTEARAKYNLANKKQRGTQYLGLTFWSPNINIFRDPRWGRGQETYGEDPFLTSVMGLSFIKGIQGNDPLHLKAAASAKHFAVHSGPEASRHEFDALVDEKDLRETYLFAFEKLVKGGVEGIMCAYNRVNNEPCCTGKTLLQKTLREEWKFDGHVVTDCWALDDVFSRHKSLKTSVETAAAAIKAGVNMDCSGLLQSDVSKAIDQGLITTKELDFSLSKILKTQFKLGFFDIESQGKYANFGEDSISNSYHQHLAKAMAMQSMVLLKNKNNILPIDKNKLNSMMIVGPNAASLDALIGNYHGVSAKAINYVEGITAAVSSGTRIEYDQGCDYKDTTHFGGIWAASNAEITLAVVGFTPVYEGEEGDAFLASHGGDKRDLSLPLSHIAYIKALHKANKKPLIVVITGGSAVDISAIEPYCDAIIFAWYAGEQGGNALADLIFGNQSPSGKLPITFYKTFDDLPSYDNYNMTGRTYRYFNGKVQYPFGFGLSYSKFDYQWQRKLLLKNDSIFCSIRVQNIGNFDAFETVQLYIKPPKQARAPLKTLKAIQKVYIRKGETQTLEFKLPLSDLKQWNLEKKDWKIEEGNYEIFIGSHSEDERLIADFKID